MLSRRTLIKNAAGFASANALLGTHALQGGVNDPSRNRVLRLVRPSTGERLRVTYWRGDWYDPQALEDLSVFLRDPDDQSLVDIDPFLLDFLQAIVVDLDHDGEVVVFDATISERTAEHRVKASRGQYDLSRERLHRFGRALDFTIPALPAARVAETATALEMGGVGHLEHHAIVHIDTGDVTTWRE